MPSVLSRARSSQADPSTIDAALRALADRTRREILLLVREEEHSAGEIAERFPSISRPAVSQHLSVLEGASLISVRKDGNRRMYRSRPDGLREAWEFIGQMWGDAFVRLKIAAEREVLRDAGGKTR